MQVARQALPLLEGGKVARLIVEPRILDRDRGLVRERPGQRAVARAVAIRFGVSSSRNPIVRSRTLSGTNSNERAFISSAVSASGALSRNARAASPSPQRLSMMSGLPLRSCAQRDHLPAREARARDHLGGQRAAVIEDHQLVALDDEDRRARASEHDLQLLQHHAQQGLELEVRGDGVRDLEQRRQLARPLRHLLLEQAQRALALGHVPHDRQDVHAPAVAESLSPQLEPGQPPVRA